MTCPVCTSSSTCSRTFVTDGMPGQLRRWSDTLWPGLWSQGKIWAGREKGHLDISGAITVSESNAACLAGWKTGRCSSVGKKRVTSDVFFSFFHLEQLAFPPAPNQLHPVWSDASSNISPLLSFLMLSLIIAACHLV